tara:strand:- start:2 stop:571 length:570 start_codon:yes stop_codon:yes gene_type:complete
MVDPLITKKYNYPFADRVSSPLYEITKQYYNGDPIKGEAKRTDADLHHKNIKEVNNLTRWVKQLIPDFSSITVGGKGSYLKKIVLERFYHPRMGGIGGFDPYNFVIDSCWGVIYNKGDSVIKHNHFPYSISFCYYVRTPSHSSPLIMEGRKMRMREGELLLFLSHYNHWVPKSKVDGRCVIVGNIKYIS